MPIYCPILNTFKLKQQAAILHAKNPHNISLKYYKQVRNFIKRK